MRRPSAQERYGSPIFGPVLLPARSAYAVGQPLRAQSRVAGKEQGGQLGARLLGQRAVTSAITGLETRWRTDAELATPTRTRAPKMGTRLSQLSHGLTGRYRTTASMPDTWQDGDLRIRIPAYRPDVRY